jgi:protein TonB
MRAGRITLSASARRPAVGASLALHGALAGAALLPLLVAPPPLRPAMPGAIEVAWLAETPTAPAAAAPAEDASAEEAAPVETEAALVPVQQSSDLPLEMPAEPPAVQPAATPLPAGAEPFPAPPVDTTTERRAEPAPTAVATAEPAPEPFPEPEPVAEPLAAAAPATAEPPPPAPVPPAPSPAATPPHPAPRPATPRAARPPAERQVGRGAAGGDPSPIQPTVLPAAPPRGPVLVTAPRFRRPPAPPDYPPRALDFGITGTVMVRARVAPDGSTEEIRLWRSSGNALLDAAALAAVRRWAFEPAAVDGRRVEAWVEVPVHFRLH